MNVLHSINLISSLKLRRFSLLLHLFSLHTRSLSPHKEKSINWNTTNPFVLSNPLLSLLERSNSITHLKQIQAQVIFTGLISNGIASSRLIAFCAISEWRNLDYCTKILFNLLNPNVFSWNVAIRGFSESESGEEAILLYKRMLAICGLKPDNYTYSLLFKVCASLMLRNMGYEILVHALHLGFDSDIFVHNGVIHMLVCCNEIVAARKVFDESSARDLVSWNSMINGYVKNGFAEESLQLFREMENEGVMPDEVTMIGLVSSCSKLEDLSLGRKLQGYIEQCRIRVTIPLANALMDMYAKCGDLKAAQKIFDGMKKRTIVSWTTMIVGYAKFGLLDIASKLFDEMPEKDSVPWNALIGGYIQAKQSKEALALFHKMQDSNVKPDEVTMVYCLSACSQLGALDIGIWIHRYIEKRKLYLNVTLGTALVNMYAKCGNVTKALQVFNEMQVKNSLTFTAIIGGLALHGDANAALSYFSKMIDVGLLPDEITYIGVLSACCHGGLVELGRRYFSEMTSKFNLSPQLKHYSCMVDLLGRAGLLIEAEGLIKNMPIEPDAAVWGALFYSCRAHGNVVMGERVGLKLLELDPNDSGIYVLLSNMYREANMWEESRKVRNLMVERGVEKTPGCSSIEVNGVVSEFIVRDKSHSESLGIYSCLIQLTRHMELAR